MFILVTFDNPTRDVVLTYHGSRGYDVCEGMWSNRPDAIALGLFDDSLKMLHAVVRGADDDAVNAAFDTLFSRSL